MLSCDYHVISLLQDAVISLGGCDKTGEYVRTS